MRSDRSITGGGRGIGAATALRLARGRARPGARPTRPTGRRRDHRRAGARRRRAAAGRAVRRRPTSTRWTGCSTPPPRLGQVTGLVNNAGSTLHLGDLADTPVEVVRRVDRRQPHRRDPGRPPRGAGPVAGGAIVNVSSGAATLGSPHEYVHYAAAKAGVDALTDGLAQEVARARHPGQRRRARHRAHRHPRRGRRPRPARAGRRQVPLGRVGEPEESPRRSPGCSATLPLRDRRDAASGRWTMRVLLALGGNAMTGPDGGARPEEQIAAAQVAMAQRRRAGRQRHRRRRHPRQRSAGRQPAGEERDRRVRRTPGAAGLVRRADPGHAGLRADERARRRAARAGRTAAQRRAS